MTRLSRLYRSRGGSVAIFSAIGLVPVVMGLAVAVDIGSMINSRAQLQNIADAAALAGAKAANTQLATEGSNPSVANAIATAQTTAQQSITTNAATAGISPLPTASITFTPVTSHSGTVTVALSQTPKLFFSNFLSGATKSVNVTATATMSESSVYVQVIFLVDVSNSMSVGGTTDEIQTLSNGPGQCAFACHDPNGYYNVAKKCSSSITSTSIPPCDMRAAAKMRGISLKIDYISQAMTSFMSQLTEYAGDQRTHVSVAIDTFGTGFTQLLPMTDNLSSAQKAVSEIDVESATPYANQWNNPRMGSVNYALYNFGYTQASTALAKVSSALTNVGDGSSDTSRKTYVIFISDGAQDVYSASTTGYSSVNLDYVSGCTTLKNQGARIFSILVPYYPLPGNWLYNYQVAPVDGRDPNHSMESAMTSCASGTETFFRADDGPAIQSALASSFDGIVSDVALHLSQ